MRSFRPYEVIVCMGIRERFFYRIHNATCSFWWTYFQLKFYGIKSTFSLTILLKANLWNFRRDLQEIILFVFKKYHICNQRKKLSGLRCLSNCLYDSLVKNFPWISSQGTYEKNLLEKLYGQGKASRNLVRKYFRSKAPMNQ